PSPPFFPYTTLFRSAVIAVSSALVVLVPPRNTPAGVTYQDAVPVPAPSTFCGPAGVSLAIETVKLDLASTLWPEPPAHGASAPTLYSVIRIVLLLVPASLSFVWTESRQVSPALTPGFTLGKKSRSTCSATAPPLGAVESPIAVKFSVRPDGLIQA